MLDFSSPIDRDRFLDMCKILFRCLIVCYGKEKLCCNESWNKGIAHISYSNRIVFCRLWAFFKINIWNHCFSIELIDCKIRGLLYILLIFVGSCLKVRGFLPVRLLNIFLKFRIPCLASL